MCGYIGSEQNQRNQFSNTCMSLKLIIAKLLMQFSDNGLIRSFFTESMTAASETFLQNGKYSEPDTI